MKKNGNRKPLSKKQLFNLAINSAVLLLNGLPRGKNLAMEWLQNGMQ
jgi:hypothetical protein